jgi:hypothetical protein
MFRTNPHKIVPMLILSVPKMKRAENRISMKKASFASMESFFGGQIRRA